MKKPVTTFSSLFLMIVLCSIFLFLSPRKAQAEQSLGIGMTTYYAWWNPSWRAFGNQVGIATGLLYGPHISFSFNSKWNLSAIYLTQAESTGFYYNTGDRLVNAFMLIMTEKSRGKIVRHDGDLILTRSMNKYLKIFGGFKLNFMQGIDRFNINIFDPSNGSFYSFPSTKQRLNFYKSYGAGFGVVGNFHLVENLYLILNGSILYMYSQSRFMSSQPSTYSVVGCNTTLSLSYYISAANLALVAGGRFQYMRYFAMNAKTDLAYPNTMKDDMFYGVTFSAVYYFNFGKKSEDTDDDEA